MLQGSRGEGEQPAHPSGAAMTGLAQSANWLDPTEHFLDPLADAHVFLTLPLAMHSIAAFRMTPLRLARGIAPGWRAHVSS
jgi:hypothetical protein